MRKRMLSGILCIVLCLSLCACGNSGQQTDPSAEPLTWQEQYDLGVRYLSEGKYAEAILAFTAAIQIDAKRAPAYMGRGDAYVGMATLALPEGADPGTMTLEGEVLTAYQNAAADYAAAAEVDATLVEAYQKAAEVYMILGDKDAAMAILQRGIEATGSQALSDMLTGLEQGGTQEPDASQSPEESSSPEPTPEADAVTVDFDPVSLLGQNISVITDKYGEPTEDWGTVWRWWAEDNSYDFNIELGTDGATIMSVSCGWGAPAILGVKAGDSPDAAKAALNSAGGCQERDAGNGQTNYFTVVQTDSGELLYDFAIIEGEVAYVSVHQMIQG